MDNNSKFDVVIVIENFVYNVCFSLWVVYCVIEVLLYYLFILDILLIVSVFGY